MFAPGGLKLDDQGYIEAAFAQLNVIDSDGDVTVAGAFPEKDVPMSAYGHSSWDGALPVGKGTISEAGDWAVFKGQFFVNTTHGNDAYLTVKGLGDLAEYSYGFNVLDSERGTHDGEPANFLKSIDPFEVSPVLKGAGIDTHTIALKHDSPGTGESMVDWISRHLEFYATAVKYYEDRDEVRKSEGRKLSAADLARLGELKVYGTDLAERIDALLLVPEDPEVVRQRQQAIEVALATARRLGVPIE